MVIMERSRSPLRSSPTLDGTRPLINLVWTRPMGYGATPQGQGQQVAHPMPSQWNQGNPGVPATQELPLSQGSMQIPPGQSGASQHSLGMSQQTVATTPSWYSPPGPQPVPPRPRVQGMGLAGMMPTFPPPPPSWDPHHATGHFRAPGNLHGSPAPPATTPSPTSVRTTPRTSPAGGPTKTARIPNIPMGQHWKQDEENYDNQKVNGLILPRTIRASSWTQLDSAQGHRRMRPLTVPLSKLFYQGSENFWLRKLATGREVYVATMGEVNQVVFVSEILSQIRSRGLDLDRLAQHKALQDGHTLEKKEAIQYITKLLGGDPPTQPDTGSQHKIAELQAKIAALEAAANQAQNQNPPAQGGSSASNPNRLQSPIEAAFQGQRPVAFDPAQLLVAPGSTNQWLETTSRSPSVSPNISHGSETSSWIMPPDKPLRETLLLWTAGGKTNLKKLKLQSTGWQCVQEYLLRKSSLGAMRTSSRSSRWH